MPAVRRLVANGGHDARRLTCFEDDDHLVRLRALEVRVDELVTPAPPGCVHHGNVPSFGPAFDPLLELFGDAAQHIPAHRVEPPVGIEETDDPLRLLERLDQAVQQDAVEAAIVEPDAVLVMIEEGVHRPAPAEADPQDRTALTPRLPP